MFRILPTSFALVAAVAVGTIVGCNSPAPALVNGPPGLAAALGTVPVVDLPDTIVELKPLPNGLADSNVHQPNVNVPLPSTHGSGGSHHSITTTGGTTGDGTTTGDDSSTGDDTTTTTGSGIDFEGDLTLPTKK